MQQEIAVRLECLRIAAQLVCEPLQAEELAGRLADFVMHKRRVEQPLCIPSTFSESNPGRAAESH
jgi:hypothetical protein